MNWYCCGNIFATPRRGSSSGRVGVLSVQVGCCSCPALHTLHQLLCRWRELSAGDLWCSCDVLAPCILDLDTVLRRDLFTPAARWRQLTLAGLRCAPCLVTTWRCDGCVTLELWHCDELIAAHCTTPPRARQCTFYYQILFDLHWQLRCLLEDVDEQWTGCQCR